MEIVMQQLRKIHPSIVYLAALSYLLFALAAYARFPGSYSPFQNWLSDLGSVQMNPGGAAFYNLGIILTGLSILLFFLGISTWQMQNRKIQNGMVRITQLFGILGSVAMLMSAVFPIHLPVQHQFWSISLYILLGTAFAFSVFALRYQPRCPRWVLVVGGITAGIDILSGIYHETTILEWITVALFIAYLLLLGRVTRRLQ
jgi:hypothetical membrane protein